MGTPARRWVATTAALALALVAANTSAAGAYEYVLSSQFGSSGSGAGQLLDPEGVAVDQYTHDVYVADAGNHRIDKFTAAGVFLSAWGWGVSDGKAQSEVCKSNCQAGLSGSGGGELSAPVAIAVDNSGKGNTGSVYVGDRADGLIERFDSSGDYVGSFPDGSGNVPAQIGGVAVDGSGNVWVYNSLGEVSELNNQGMDLQVWSTPFGGGVGFGIDGNDNVYAAVPGFGVEKFSSSGTDLGELFSGEVTGLTVSAADDGVFVDQGKSVSKYRISAALPSAAVATFGGGTLVQGTGVSVDPTSEKVYVADRSAESVYVFEPPPPGPPQIGGVTVVGAIGQEATLVGELYSGRLDTKYQFEYGPTEAYGLLAPAQPLDIGSGLQEVSVEQSLTGLTPGVTYHYRISASNSQGTVVSADHTFTPFTLASAGLPDDRAYELVSPPNKNGGDAGYGELFGGEMTAQASSSGTAVAYDSPTAFDGSENSGVSEYLSTRGQLGWSTQPISPAASAGGEGELVAAARLFSDDLSSDVLEWSRGALTPEAPLGLVNLYVRDNRDGTYRLVTTSAGARGYPEVVGASAENSHVVFQTDGVLTEGASPEGTNIYEWSNGQLELVSIPPGSSTGVGNAVAGGLADRQNSVSTDGRIVFWTDPKRQLYAHVDGASTLWLNASQRTPSLGDGVAGYLGATPNGRLAFFSDATPLTNGQSDNGGLYEFDTSSGLLTNLSPDEAATPSIEGVLGYGDDGSYVYFVSKTVLAGGATAGAPNLYVAHAGSVALIAKLASADQSDWSSNLQQRHSAVTPDGTHVAFTSLSPLTGVDNTDRVHHSADAQVFDYDALTSRLYCVSCNPAGERPIGPSSIPTWRNLSYNSHYLSNDGSHLFFNSRDALSPHDIDGKQDVYEWEPEGVGGCARTAGCVSLISSGTSNGDSALLAAGTNGEDVFFATHSQLTPQDIDDKFDIYDARVGGGFPIPSPEPARCEAETCLGPLSPPPPSLAPMTLAPLAGGEDNGPTGGAVSGARLTVDPIGSGQLRRATQTGELTLHVAASPAGEVWAEVRGKIGSRLRVIAHHSPVGLRAGRVRLRLTLSRVARETLAQGRELRVRITVGCSNGAASRQLTAVLGDTRRAGSGGHG